MGWPSEDRTESFTSPGKGAKAGQEFVPGPLGRSAALGTSPFRLVEQPALGQLAGLVAVKAEVTVDAAGAMLGFPDGQANQGQDEERGNAANDPFHGGAGSREGGACHPAANRRPRPTRRAATPARGYNLRQ